MTHSNTLRGMLVASSIALLAACGGGGSADAPPPPEGEVTPPVVVPPAPIAPTITLQPVAVTGIVGATATFTVAATGTDPITYQWQRNGVAIVGATGTSYTTPSLTLADTGATFRAVATNVAGSATSNAATLTVNPAANAPVLTITLQPTNLTVTAGGGAYFIIAATCSSGTLQVQWQRAPANSTAFADIPGATGANFLYSPSIGDNGSQFRANLSCGGQSPTTTTVVTLTVTPAASVTLSAFTVSGRRALAPVNRDLAIDKLPDGSYALINNGIQVWKLAADLSSIALFAGGDGGTGDVDGTGPTVVFANPLAIAHDAAGNLYVSEVNTVRKVTPAGVVSTVAGTYGTTGSADGMGAAASFNTLRAIAVGPEGDLYLADGLGNKIRRVTTAGVVTTYAGTGIAGQNNGAAATATFSNPAGLAFDASGNLYVSDYDTSVIRRILRNGTTAGNVDTFAGSGSTTAPGADAVGLAAGIPNPGMMFMNGTTLYVRDINGLIRAIDIVNGAVSTFTGSRSRTAGGLADGPLGSAAFDLFSSGGMTAGVSGGLMVADTIALRSVDASGVVTTLGDSTTLSFDFSLDTSTGLLSNLRLLLDDENATRIAVDPQGRLVVSDSDDQMIRRVDSSGNVTLVAGLLGSNDGRFPASPLNGVGSAAAFRDNGGALAITAAGVMYTSARYGIERIGTDDTGTFLTGDVNVAGCVDGPVGTARFTSVRGIAFLPNGDLLVSDAGCMQIRRVDATGTVSAFSGNGTAGKVDGASGVAEYQSPGELRAVGDGTFWVADNGILRHIAADGSVASPTNPVGYVKDFVIEPSTITIYASTVAGLEMYVPFGGAHSVIVPASNTQQPQPPTLGSINPSLGDYTLLGAITMLAPKQLLLRTGTTLSLVALP